MVILCTTLAIMSMNSGPKKCGARYDVPMQNIAILFVSNSLSQLPKLLDEA